MDRRETMKILVPGKKVVCNQATLADYNGTKEIRRGNLCPHLAITDYQNGNNI